MEERSEDTHITFTLGQGNHSSICGGVAPMRVEGVPDEAKPAAKSDEGIKVEVEHPNSAAAQ